MAKKKTKMVTKSTPAIPVTLADYNAPAPTVNVFQAPPGGKIPSTANISWPIPGLWYQQGNDIAKKAYFEYLNAMNQYLTTAADQSDRKLEMAGKMNGVVSSMIQGVSLGAEALEQVNRRVRTGDQAAVLEQGVMVDTLNKLLKTIWVHNTAAHSGKHAGLEVELIDSSLVGRLNREASLNSDQFGIPLVSADEANTIWTDTPGIPSNTMGGVSEQPPDQQPMSVQMGQELMPEPVPDPMQEENQDEVNLDEIPYDAETTEGTEAPPDEEVVDEDQPPLDEELADEGQIPEEEIDDEEVPPEEEVIPEEGVEEEVIPEEEAIQEEVPVEEELAGEEIPEEEGQEELAEGETPEEQALETPEDEIAEEDEEEVPEEFPEEEVDDGQEEEAIGDGEEEEPPGDTGEGEPQEEEGEEEIDDEGTPEETEDTEEPFYCIMCDKEVTSQEIAECTDPRCPFKMIVPPEDSNFPKQENPQIQEKHYVMLDHEDHSDHNVYEFKIKEFTGAEGEYCLTCSKAISYSFDQNQWTSADAKAWVSKQFKINKQKAKTAEEIVVESIDKIPDSVLKEWVEEKTVTKDIVEPEVKEFDESLLKDVLRDVFSEAFSPLTDRLRQLEA